MLARILIFSTLVVILGACQSSIQKLALPQEYNQYLQPVSQQKFILAYQQEIDFWQQKLNTDSLSSLYLGKVARLWESRFRKSGNIEELRKAQYLLKQANQISQGKEVGILHSLALNAITCHEFREAEQYLIQAFKLGQEKAITSILYSDVQLELGNPKSARDLLNRWRFKNDFDFLIRDAKLLDHEGKLDEAIAVMEKAHKIIQEYQQPDYHTWILTSLADMYGHAGRVEESYQMYLKALEIDPELDYALKGIAWIAYSHDHNPSEAKRILKFISQRNSSPDFLLKLAEIAEYEGNEKEKQAYLRDFKQIVERAEYGDMYNKYLVELHLEEWKNYDKAKQIAEKEVQNRPTAQSYDLLAWVYFKEGQLKKAYQIAKDNVENQSFEPDILYHLGMIFKANGQIQRGNQLLREAKEASFELGCIATQKIEDEIEKG
jgi:tetratricopeptide (TPR) repeat protein